jgi:phage terminase large subunit-like protein
MEEKFRLFLAGNRSGKTLSGAFETAMHATGRYPNWWKGLELKSPKKIWVFGVTMDSIKQALIPYYLGGNEESDIGTGCIPKDAIISWKRNNQTRAIQEVVLKHKAGHNVVLSFMAYEQGREKFQSAKVDFIHLDEEPDAGIFAECAYRTVGTGGGMILTMTPLKGMTQVCMDFLEDTKDSYGYVQASIFDNPYIPEDEVNDVIAATEPHLLEARTKGVPSVGSGRIYPVVESSFLVEPFSIPAHYVRLFGMDFGWENTAVVFGAWDRDADIVYIYDCYIAGERTPEEHMAYLPKDIRQMQGVCDPSGGGTSQADGQRAIEQYQEYLNVEKADNAVEAGIMKVLQRLRAGKLKIINSPNMEPWLKEFRMYARDEKGKVKKSNDHLMDSTRYLVMSGLHNVNKVKNFYSKARRKARSWMTV